MNKRHISVISFFLAFSGLSVLSAQQLRGAVVGELHLSDAVNKKQVAINFSLEDLVGLYADTDTSLMEGIEIKIDIPRGINQYRNSFALYLYKNVSPAPTSTHDTYRGVQTYMRMLPVLDTCFVIIPFLEGNSFRQDATTLVVPQPVRKDEFPLILTIQPVAKALPPGIYDHTFKISIKPLYSDTGFLTINGSLNGSDKLKDIFIDGKLWSGSLSGIPLVSGVHSVMILSVQGEKEVQNVVIESGKTTVLQYTPDTREPSRIQFLIPPGMDVFIDGKPVVFENDQKTVKVTPGVHQIGYFSGDFTYVKTIEISAGDSIRCSLQMDLMIEKF